MQTIQTDGVAHTPEGYRAWFNIGNGDYFWSSATFNTEAEAREYGLMFVRDFNRLQEAVKDVPEA